MKEREDSRIIEGEMVVVFCLFSVAISEAPEGCLNVEG